MINSSPVLPHELQFQSLSGEITTGSLRVLATTRNYSSSDGRSIGSIWATSFEAVATAAGEKSQPALWSELSDRSSTAPERLLLDAIAAGELDEHGRFRSGELRCPPLALDKLDRPTWQPAA
jgi:hypothetical protein